MNDFLRFGTQDLALFVPDFIEFIIQVLSDIRQIGGIRQHGEKSFSFLKGYSFLFDDDGRKIEAWFSALSGLEKVFVDGDLISSKRNVSTQTSNNFNAPRAVTRSAILYVLRSLVNKKIPLNDGCLKPIKIIIPKNSILSPKFPAAVVAGNVETSQTIVDVINSALKVQSACYGTMSNFTFGNKDFGYYETICGGEGASRGHNGTDAVQCHMTNTRLTDPEILELRYPIKINNFSIRKNSGGKGKFKGGNGVIREIEFEKSLTAVILSNRRKVSPPGILYGEKAQKGINLFKTKNKKIKKLNSSESINVKKGDIIIIKTPGGGGYGKKATV